MSTSLEHGTAHALSAEYIQVLNDVQTTKVCALSYFFFSYLELTKSQYGTSALTSIDWSHTLF